jgi:hypothetical protein
MGEGRSSSGLAALVTFAFCLFWAGVLLSPALLAPHERIAMDIGDPVLNASILEWNARTLPLTREWWNFPAFAPAEGVTAFTEHLLGFYPFATPLIWLTGQPVVTYNLLLLMSFPLTGLAMFALARRLTGSDIGAFVAAVAVTFAPYRVSQLSHVQMLWTFGIPLALLGLHQWVDGRVRTGLVLFAAGWLVTAAANGYLMVFFGIYLLFWVLWFCTTPAAIRRLPAIVGVGLAATLPLVPVLLGYFTVHRDYALQRSLSEVAHFSADITGIVRPWAGSMFVSRWLTETAGEGALYPGLAIVTLAVAGVVKRARRLHRRPLVRVWIARALLAAAMLFFAASAVALVTDVRYDLGFARLSISNHRRPFAIAITALLAAIAVNPPARAALWVRSPVVFHALMVPVLWVLSLGPVGRVNGVPVATGLPYEWLLKVPGMAALRVPARFWVLATFSLAVLAAYGAARLTRAPVKAASSRPIRWAGRAVVVLAVALMLVEGWVPVAGEPVNPFSPVAPVRIEHGPVLELPMDRVDQNTVAMLRAATGGYRTMNGHSGFEPPHFGPLRFGMRVRDGEVLNELRRWTPFQVSVRSDDADGLRSWIARSQREATLVTEAGGRALYAVPRSGRDSLSPITSSAMSPGPILPFTITRASCGHTVLQDLGDGSLSTRWECGPGRPGQFIEADVGAARRISGIVNSLGPYSNDAPRWLHITVSGDGQRWVTAWEGPTAAFALRAAFENRPRMDTVIRFTPVSARYVRLTQTGEQTEWFWSIAELAIIGD